MVIEVETSSSGMPSNAMRMSSRLSMATPVRPTSPAQRGSSESSPSWVGRSKAMLRPVDALAAAVDAPRPLAVAIARAVLAERRDELLSGAAGDEDLAARASARAQPSLRRVLNATGVIVHTNLGRAPLSAAAREAVARVAEGYSNLELDLAAGARGSRHAPVADLLRELTGAAAAPAVNHGAGAAPRAA